MHMKKKLEDAQRNDRKDKRLRSVQCVLFKTCVASVLTFGTTSFSFATSRFTEIQTPDAVFGSHSALNPEDYSTQFAHKSLVLFSSALDSNQLPQQLNAEDSKRFAANDISQDVKTSSLAKTKTNLSIEPSKDNRPQSQRYIAVGDRYISRALIETIFSAAKRTSTDPVYLLALADFESNLNPKAHSKGSSALGLFQFLSSTWLGMVYFNGSKYGLEKEAQLIQKTKNGYLVKNPKDRQRILSLREDPYISSLLAGELINTSKLEMRRLVGRKLTRAELYLAHFLGTYKAKKFILLAEKAPGKIASKVFTNEAYVNQGLFRKKTKQGYRPRTISEVYALLNHKMVNKLKKFEDLDTLDLSSPS